MVLYVQPSSFPVFPHTHTQKGKNRTNFNILFSPHSVLIVLISCWWHLVSDVAIKLKALPVHSVHNRPWRAITASGAGFKERSRHHLHQLTRGGKVSITSDTSKCGSGSLRMKTGARRGWETGNELKKNQGEGGVCVCVGNVHSLHPLRKHKEKCVQ